MGIKSGKKWQKVAKMGKKQAKNGDFWGKITKIIKNGLQVVLGTKI